MSTTVRARVPEALVALFSDHLVPFHSDLAEHLAQHADERRLRFTVWGSGLAPGEVRRPGTHFDVTPTLMDLLGFDAFTEHHLGASLLRFDSPWFSRENPHALRVVHRLSGLALRPGEDVTFEPEGPVIAVGDSRMLATGRGLSLEEGFFAIVFDADGSAADFRHFPSAAAGRGGFGEFLDWARGRAVVGVSAHRGINRRLLTGGGAEGGDRDGAATAWFAGYPGTPYLAAGPLRSRVTVTLPEGARGR